MKDTQKEVDSVEGTDFEAAWADEIERRIAEVETGEAGTSTWEEARTRIRSSLAKSGLR
jgi:putative addiction module component (TIGR02574 family)